MLSRNYNRLLCIGGVIAILGAIFFVGFYRADTLDKNSRQDSTNRSFSLSSSAHRSERARKRKEEDEKCQLRSYQLEVETAKTRAHIQRVRLMEMEYSRASCIKRWEKSDITTFLFLINNPLNPSTNIYVNNSDLHAEAQEEFRERLDSILNEFDGDKGGSDCRAVWIQVIHEVKDKKKITQVARFERNYPTYEDFVEGIPSIKNLVFGPYRRVDFGTGWRYSHLLDVKKMKPMPRFKLQKQLDMGDW